MHTGGDGDAAQQLAQLLVVAHGQLDVAGHNAGLFVVAGGVACQLQNLRTPGAVRPLHAQQHSQQCPLTDQVFPDDELSSFNCQA